MPYESADWEESELLGLEYDEDEEELDPLEYEELELDGLADGLL